VVADHLFSPNQPRCDDGRCHPAPSYWAYIGRNRSTAASPGDKTVEESYRSKLRITMRPLIEERDAFLNYSKQDKSLSAEQRRIVEEIQKASLPILKQKKIEGLTSEELIQSISDESSTIAPLVKQFLDKMDAGKKRVAQ
jgi:hypothetical protein